MTLVDPDRPRDRRRRPPPRARGVPAHPPRAADAGERGPAASGRRRTPGLRREEVAQLAGVGVTWYTWLEQGRDINASAQVLDAIARTLRLDEHERSHLFTLAGTTDGTPRRGAPSEPRRRARARPARAVSGDRRHARYDILAYNRAGALVSRASTRSPRRIATCCGCSSPARVARTWSTGTRRPHHGGPVPRHDGRARRRAGLEDAGRVVHRTRRSSPICGPGTTSAGRRTRSSASSTPWSGSCACPIPTWWLDPGLGTRIVAYTPVDNRTAGRLEALQRTLDANGAVA